MFYGNAPFGVIGSETYDSKPEAAPRDSANDPRDSSPRPWQTDTKS
jgi:hypothetical protein